MVAYAIDPILLILLILQLVETPSMDWMDARPFAYLGAISYSTYLYQQIVIPFVTKVLPDQPKPLISVVCLLVTWAAASVSYYLVEKPFLGLKERFTARSVRADR